MKISTCVPDRLPLRKLDWEQLTDLLGKAHAAIARYDELLRRVKHPQKVFSVLTNLEALASLHSQHVSANLEQLLLCTALGNQVHETCDAGIIKIINYKKALLSATRKIKKSTFSFEFLCETHKMIKQDTPSQKIGKFRDQQNWIGPEGCKIEEAYFYPPNNRILQKSMDNLKEYFFYQEKDPLVQIAIFFAQLLVIHPFMDGNGRVGRIFIPLFLYKKKLTSEPMFYMSAYFKKHRLDYFEKLFNISEEDAWIEWIRFFLKGVIQGGERHINHARKILSLYEEIRCDMAHFENANAVIDSFFETPIIMRDVFQEDDRRVLKKLEEKKWVHSYKTRSMVAMKPLLTIDRV